MDQIKTGKFIAEMRKEQNLTQRQLADALLISDKTVSKWECGKGLPEVSLMLPLCDILKITVNDLLSGRRVSEGEYKKKAEENIMNLMKENEENMQRAALSAICGVVTIIAVCSLIVIASYIPMDTFNRVAILVFAVATAVLGIGAAAVLERKAGYFECPHCRELFVPEMKDYVAGVHTLTKRMLPCPKCGKKSMCRHIITRK
jgi:transcriptional regulator with XRE-family HTH domain/predicted RNA-binding Zn-ribbon protein involved in translation (DUF1610 family)